MSNRNYRKDNKTWEDKKAIIRHRKAAKRDFVKAVRRHNHVIVSRGYGELALYVKTLPWL